MFGKLLSGLGGGQQAAGAEQKSAASPGADVSFSAESLDPGDWLAPDQRIVHQGLIWKLNADGDPRAPEFWLKRMMWLTSAGGLFYFSHKNEKPLGRHIRGLKLKPVQYFKNQFAFEVHLPDMGSTVLAPTVLATDTSEERDEWLQHLRNFEHEAAEDDDELSPLDVFGKSQSVGGAASRRPGRRSSVDREAPCERLVSARSSEAYCSERAMFPSQDDEPELAFGRMVSDAGCFGNPVPTERLSAPPVMGRRSSQVSYAEKAHTALLLDWDDTIFPTTWVREDCGMNWKLSLDAQLEPGPRKVLIEGLLGKLADAADNFMKQAVVGANIFVVTLSRRPWVETSSRNFLPSLGRLLEQNNLKVIYAQEYVTDKMSREYAHGDEFKSSEQVAAFWTKVKAEAMTKELEDFHRRNGITWKNVISLGDSDFERYGTIAAGEDYIKREVADSGQILSSGATAEAVSKDGRQLKLRTKTVKMLGEPTVEELTAELTLLTRWLPHMVRQDSGFDVEIDSTDDDARLQALHTQITGEDDAELSWARLAGMGEG